MNKNSAHEEGASFDTTTAAAAAHSATETRGHSFAFSREDRGKGGAPVAGRRLINICYRVRSTR